MVNEATGEYSRGLPKLPNLSAIGSRSVRRLENALELLLAGTVSSPYAAPHRVLQQRHTHAVRRYGEAPPTGNAPVVVLIPPLMVRSEVFDIDPEISAVQMLLGHGVDVWLCDFGKPEEQTGGMERTFNDHVLAVDHAVDVAVQTTGKPVHLIGFSQGGMFAWEVAAFRRCEGIASLITFGSPVDLSKSLPFKDERVSNWVFERAANVFEKVVDTAKGFPAESCKSGFRVLGLSKEPQQIAKFLTRLDDRTALESQERRYRFLHGDGFAGFPGPALQGTIEYVVEGRLLKGGLVIDGRAVSMSDITCPILYFTGATDALVSDEAAGAIVEAAPNADCYHAVVPAGHFGLVVGRVAKQHSWPTVAQWTKWVERGGPLPQGITPPGAESKAAALTVAKQPGRLRSLAKKATSAIKTRVEHVFEESFERFEHVRWQAPRVDRLARLRPDSVANIGALLTEQAEAIGDKTFFLWEGRAFTYAQTDTRVTAVAKGLIEMGVGPDDRVVVLMDQRPSYLSAVAALNRLGAVAIPLSPSDSNTLLTFAFEQLKPSAVITDANNVATAADKFNGTVLVLGGGHPRPELPERAFDLETLDPAVITLPSWYKPDQRRADELCMILCSEGRGGKPRAARITNLRWLSSALGSAIATALTSRDTVYCGAPLSHATGIIVSVGASLVGGARFALSSAWTSDNFWPEVRRYGATVVFYAGEMGRILLAAPPQTTDRNHSIRLLAGSGMRADAWRKLQTRFGPLSIVEMYGSTENNAVTANVSGKNVGSIGHRIPGSTPIAVVRFDFAANDFVRDAEGYVERCARNEPGVLISKLDSSKRQHRLSKQTMPEDNARIMTNVFPDESRWFNTRDVVYKDDSDALWVVGRVSEMFVIDGVTVSARQVEEQLYAIDAIELVAVIKVNDQLVAAATCRPDRRLDLAALNACAEQMAPQERPKSVHIIDRMPLTAGFRPLKRKLESILADAPPNFVYSDGRYTRVSPSPRSKHATH